MQPIPAAQPAGRKVFSLLNRLMQVARELGMEFLMSPEFWLFAVVGFLAQLCDGALGMGFGVISSTVLASMGVEPKIVSASVNSAKIVTGGAATVSHLMYRNIDRQLLLSLGLGGVIGATIGVLVLTQLPTKWVQTTVSCYLICVGIIILSRYFRKVEHRERAVNPTVIGIAGGVLESIAGVWGRW
ncbi:sulfite exporter TauE/SafE family protein [Hankyongella ginsenosidimutans]|uniref:Probable membrane transporter protein n=1 Tax=Hankyongella ginsenosidimutans TaxID=1763828 RepID=A0A4D7C1C1_9SPHN|nr:sulfite exporter TauE/SafE family protein [Hankyongella ginsenosidimutans]QCI79514.1 sulfite exporter TauE/SafE family protein [Hankyongella ginsenosidimutans]